MQSLRVINVGCFAEDGAYHCPESVIDKEAFHGAMLCTQDQYNAAVMSGEKIEDARGLLPLNIHSPITFSCSYRSLIGMLKQRLCVAAQEEWVGVSEQMRAELANVHPILAEPLDCMCKRFANNKGFCKTLHKEV
jgi:thymidylate synthase ThyX